MAWQRAGSLHPEYWSRSAPGLGVVAQGVSVVDVHECDVCGALVAEDSIARHVDWHANTIASRSGE